MKVITLARKPIVDSVMQCALTWGAGGLGIDACRIETGDNLNGGAYSGGGRGALPGDVREGAAAGMFAEGGGRLPGMYKQPPGRWPSNLIFQHQVSCTIVGERQVRTGVAVRERSGGKNIFSEQTKPPLENLTYGEGGQETIPDWSCSTSCPVPEIDRQSGISTSKSHDRNNKGSWKVRKKGNTIASMPTPHADTGGASRFFKQVKP